VVAVTGGIGEALIATACGLGIAIVSLIPFNYFTGRLTRLQFELEAAATNVEMMVAPRMMEENTIKVEGKRRTGAPVEPGLSK
jgi:biopolymer transport protein ExbB